jgi:hypothetical protein
MYRRIGGIARIAGFGITIAGLFLIMPGAGSAQLAAPVAQGDSHYFPETKHTVSGKFWAYWQSHGGLAQQGYPISDEFTEVSDLDGKPYTVQYFERAVFEMHPENAGTPYEILLSQRGTFRLQEKYPNGVVSQAGAGEVGISTAQTAWEYVGQNDQNGGDFAGYGYLTHINGIPDDSLFTTNDPTAHSEATAHFTYYTTAKLTARSIISSVFVLNASGTFNIYYNASPHGDFNNPSSFNSGTQVSTSTLRFQDILNVQGPNKGLETGMGELTQSEANPFTLDSTQYRFGRPGLISRLYSTGEGIRTDPTLPKSVVFGAGNVVVTGQGAP